MTLFFFLIGIVKQKIQSTGIVPAVALAGSWIHAFEDVNTTDPHFEYIQALAKAGITFSKLSGEDTQNDLRNLTCLQSRYQGQR